MFFYCFFTPTPRTFYFFLFRWFFFHSGVGGSRTPFSYLYTPLEHEKFTIYRMGKFNRWVWILFYRASYNRSIALFCGGDFVFRWNNQKFSMTTARISFAKNQIQPNHSKDCTPKNTFEIGHDKIHDYPFLRPKVPTTGLEPVRHKT